MTFFDIVLISIGLSMDAVAVSMTNGMVYGRQKTLAMPVFFGAFQALMPLLGYVACGVFAVLISQYAKVAVFVILGIIGGKMIKDGWQSEDDWTSNVGRLTYQLLLFQAIATSIDAFAVGIGFGAIGVHILSCVTIIGLTTFFCSLLAIIVGKKFGDFLGGKAEILGGIILVFIGLKALF